MFRLGILRLYERQLLEMDFEEVVQFLTHLPETMTSTELFRNIEPFMRSYASTAETTKCKRRFLQVEPVFYFWRLLISQPHNPALTKKGL